MTEPMPGVDVQTMENLEEKDNRGARILIVDDTPKNIQVLGTILKENGYKLNVAKDGLQALKIVKKVSPDLILLDIMMPELDGYETCKRLKKSSESKNIPVIFLTSKTETEDIVTGFKLGGVDYVSKPFNPTELLARINTHITLSRKTKQLREIADRDALTMIPNRRRFEIFFGLEWRRCMREQTPISIIMIDIDYFKDYNDYYGHQEGDRCLKQIAKTIHDSLNRPGDLAARYGGEEFVVVLGNTEAASAMSMAEKLRSKIADLGIPHNLSKAANVVTSSFGVATMIPERKIDRSELVKTADERLYEAKNAGRNQVK